MVEEATQFNLADARHHSTLASSRHEPEQRGLKRLEEAMVNRESSEGRRAGRHHLPRSNNSASSTVSTVSCASLSTIKGMRRGVVTGIRGSISVALAAPSVDALAGISPIQSRPATQTAGIRAAHRWPCGVEREFGGGEGQIYRRPAANLDEPRHRRREVRAVFCAMAAAPLRRRHANSRARASSPQAQDAFIQTGRRRLAARLIEGC